MASTRQILELSGQWTLQEQGKEVKIPVTVPGDVYADLLRAGRISDPFYRDNENNLQWIGESNWRYSRTFHIPADLLEHERVLLRCEGLDTFATVYVNEKEIATTDNMFRTWEWEVNGLVTAGENHIQIDFSSTLPYIREKQAERPLPWWDGMKVACHGWVRKEQCNYGWDWGIKAVTCGIWRPIRIVAFNTARLEGVRIAQDHSHQDPVRLAVYVSVENLRGEPLRIHVQVLRNELVVTQEKESFQGKNCVVGLTIHKPELWWPNNMGAQPLYDVVIELKDAEGKVLDTATKRIGLRTLRLDRHPDRWGESFQFVVNGVSFFARGANWIPADGILARMTPHRYRRLVEDAAAANMNMLRVWGGGIYEDDAFYDACDALGICVWQDFMFACATYPTYDESFLATVTMEARDNIQRLRHHPCLALWCGNNELEQGLVSESWSERTMSWEDYGRLFDKLLPDLVCELDPERDYWPSSPHSPCGDRQDAQNPTCGDAHLWSVWFGKQPFKWYRTCEHRFISEFGFQSFPEPKTVYSYTAPEDRNVTSWVMEHHQRSGIGNTTIMQYMLDWFRLPEGFENTLWTSQILQGMAIKYAGEHWRRSMPRSTGMLYWQLNDTWPVASWSSIDYYGRWKALHYLARRFLAPLLVSGVEDGDKGTVEIHVTNDLMMPAEGTVRWMVTDLSGAELTSGEKPIKISPRTNCKVETLPLTELVAKYGQRNLLVWLELVANGRMASTNLVLFAPPKHLELNGKPGITASIKEQSDGSFTVTLKTQQPALWCWLELEGVDAVLSDNFVHLRPGTPVTITVRPERRLTTQTFQKRLIVRSLVDTYLSSHISKAT